MKMLGSKDMYISNFDLCVLAESYLKLKYNLHNWLNIIKENKNPTP